MVNAQQTAMDVRRDAADGRIAQPRIEHHRFSGPVGAQTLPNEGRLESFDAESFEAQIASVHLGDVVLRRITITPHRAIVDGRTRGDETAMLRLLVVRRGVVFAAPPGGRPERFDFGDALFVCDSRPYVYQTTDLLESVATTLPVSGLPPNLRRLDALPVGPLPRSPLVDAVVELLFGLADRLDEPWTFDADYAAQGIIDLQAAILSEVMAPRTSPPGLDRIYEAAIDYIGRHLAEPDLRPPRIADAVGVSVRYLHRAFADQGVSVARSVRDLRLERVASTLRSAERRPSLDALAARFGFAGQEPLARAFQRRYGVSMTAYQRSVSS